MTPSPGTRRRSAWTISARRPRTARSGSGMAIMARLRRQKSSERTDTAARRLSKCSFGLDDELTGAREAVGGHDRACDLLGSIRAISVARDGEDSWAAVEFHRQR